VPIALDPDFITECGNMCKIIIKKKYRVPIALDPDFITECGNMCNSFCWFLSESEAFQV
jgi:hypothetical protein